MTSAESADSERDPDQAALDELASRGHDLSQFMMLDFYLAIPDEGAAALLDPLIRAAGYRPEVGWDEEEQLLILQCSKLMLPEHASIVDAQVELGRLTLAHGGMPHGWGTAGNALN